MTIAKARSRPPHVGNGSNHTHGHNQTHTTSQPVAEDYPHNHEQVVQTAATSVLAAPDLAENVERAARLIRLLEDQQRAERLAYERGWDHCAEAMAHHCAVLQEASYEAGYAAAIAEVNATWKEVAARAHYLGSPESRTYAERRASELEELKPRAGDFPGLENDPHALERYSASVESIDRPQRRAA